MEHAARIQALLKQLERRAPGVDEPRLRSSVLGRRSRRARPARRALMLGHVHPDADVLGTLLALGLALEATRLDA